MTADPAWFAESDSLHRDAYVTGTFVFETAGDGPEAVAHLCREQSTAQWKRPGREEDFRPKHGAKCVSLRELVKGRWEARIAYPHVNFGAKIPNLLTTLLGEGTFFSPEINRIRLTDLDFPDAYAARFPGPAFGIEGVRNELGVRGRPLFFGVVKPNVGLAPAEFAALAEAAWTGGLDACKDDEMLADAPWSPLAERARLCGAARNRAEAATGERKMYVANVTDEPDRIAALGAEAKAGGANALMLNALPIGLSCCRILRPLGLPILSHFDMVAAVSRAPGHGADSAVLTLLQRLAGFDIILFPGLGARMKTTEDEVRANIRACVRPLGGLRPALPVPGGSSRPEDLPGLTTLVGSTDFGMVPGRAVFEHPSGPAAGAASFRAAFPPVAS
jgi:ribulose-bisphosphate carboxylase large chain